MISISGILSNHWNTWATISAILMTLIYLFSMKVKAKGSMMYPSVSPEKASMFQFCSLLPANLKSRNMR